MMSLSVLINSPLISSFFTSRPSKQQVKQGHSYGNAIRDLIKDNRTGAVTHSGDSSTPQFTGPGVH
jgi:hypothetical protein